MRAILETVFEKSNSKEKTYLIFSGEIGKVEKLNCSFNLIKSMLSSQSMKLWWQFLHLIVRNIALKQLSTNSHLHSWFPEHCLKPPEWDQMFFIDPYDHIDNYNKLNETELPSQADLIPGIISKRCLVKNSFKIILSYLLI